METPLLKKEPINYWFLPLLMGLIFVVIGIWCFLTPLNAYLTLARLFSISFLVSGIFEMAFAISNRKKLNNWEWTLVSGILGFIVGILLISNPLISIVLLPYFVGLVVLFRSIMAVAISLGLKRDGRSDWGDFLILGILGIIFSCLLLWNPVLVGLSLVYWTSFAFIATGIFYIYISFNLKKAHHK